MVVYASTIVIITWILSRALGSLTGHLNFQRAIDALNETFEDAGRGESDNSTDTVHGVFLRGLPLVVRGDARPSRVVVFARNGKLERFTPLVALARRPGRRLRIWQNCRSWPRLSAPTRWCSTGRSAPSRSATAPTVSW